jgi:exodeoxyribonuclease VII large subunit
MSKPAKTQWDFGELFPTEATRRVLTVSELTVQVKRLLEKQVGQVWVTGEITNLRAQSSGHIYFTLKDASTQLACVLFRGEASAQRALLKDGQKVVLQGELTVYEPRGQYQMRVTAVELQGVGALQLAFERLKQRLNAEGLFAPERKRPLPRFPLRLGLVTSPTGAAIQDVLHVVSRRNPALEIILAPCRVQGQGAAEEVAAAIRLLNEFTAHNSQCNLDLILVTRGGGSLEDLWAFNEEIVARAIFESGVPVVSAVGHEIDFSISDFVADFRAATPSAAAEIITEGMFASRQFVAEAADRLQESARTRLNRLGEGVEEASARLARLHPQRRVDEQWQRLDDLQTGLLRVARFRSRELHARWQSTAARLLQLKPARVLAQRREGLNLLQNRLGERTRFHLAKLQASQQQLGERLRLLSPENVLARGYSITTDERTGNVIRAAAETKPGQRLKTRLKSGTVRSVVEE